MAYLGNSPSNQSFTPAIDYFNGNGVAVTFTLSRPVASVAQIICAIDNVVQNSTSAYTVSGNSITFTSAPLSGTNNIWVQYTSLITTYAGISQDPSVIGDITATGGFLATGDFGNTYTDGLTIYNGGQSARTALAKWDQSGNMGLGTTSPSAKLHIVAGNGNQLILDNTGQSYTEMDFYSNGSVKSQIFSDNTNGNFTINARTAGGSMIFNTVNTERMRISAAGYITTPSQPCFMTTSNSTTTPGNVIFSNVVTNISSSYNVSTGIFTAPISGTYLFFAQIMAVNGSGRIIWYIQRNGITITQGGGASTDYQISSSTAIFAMTAGDTAKVYMLSGTPYPSSSEGAFGGRLLG